MVKVTRLVGDGRVAVDEYPQGDSFRFEEGILYITQAEKGFAAYLQGHVAKVEITSTT